MLLKFIRIFFYIIWVCASCTVGIFAGFFRPFSAKNTKLVSTLIKSGRHFLGVKVTMRNAEYMDAHRPCVFISNHQDNMDIIPGTYAVPDDTVTIGKRDILYIPFFGLFYWLAGNILINRGNKKAAFGTMDQAAAQIRDRKISVWIMPEGTRSRGRGLLPFKKGPFITAIKAGVPIVPVAISSYIRHLDFKKWNSGQILIEVLPAVETTGLKPEDATALKDKCHALMLAAITRLDLEVEKNLEAKKK
jgi:1-acyl-sn-glycerol-3-phosphate acyltransferase